MGQVEIQKMRLDQSTLRRLWPRAPAQLVASIAANSAIDFAKYGLNTPLRVAHFMAQISHESDGGTITEENMNYRTAARIAAVWPSRFTPDSAQAYVGKPRELANKVYNGRMGNRTGTNDGYNFRGRGLLQLTGRESYQRIGSLTGLDLVNDPGLVANPSNALTVAACEFQYLKCLSPADDDDIRTVTKRVNGGYIGIDSRRNWLAKWKLAIPNLPGELPDKPKDLEEIDNQKLPREADGDPAKKTMAESTEGWAAIVATISAIAASVGQAIEALKPLFSDARVITAFATLGACAGIYIWFRRRNRLNQDHV